MDSELAKLVEEFWVEVKKVLDIADLSVTRKTVLAMKIEAAIPFTLTPDGFCDVFSQVRVSENLELDLERITEEHLPTDLVEALMIPEAEPALKYLKFFSNLITESS